MPSTKSFNVCRVFFSRFPRNEDEVFQAIALVDPADEPRNVGLLYRLRDNTRWDSEIRTLTKFAFLKNKSFKSRVKLFSMPQSSLDYFESIVYGTRPSHDNSNLVLSEVGSPRDPSRTWVAEIINKVRDQLLHEGLLPEAKDS